MMMTTLNATSKIDDDCDFVDADNSDVGGDEQC